MSELTKKLYCLKTGSTEPEEITLYDSTEDCEEPYLSLQVDGVEVYAKLGEVTDDEATGLRVLRSSDGNSYAVLREAIAWDDEYIDDEYIAWIKRTITSFEDDELISIGSSAFSSCSNLTSIDLPAATSIDSSAFSNCSKLTSIDLPAATSIDSSAFSNCYKLTSIDLPAATSIDTFAFSNCYNLTSIDLPAATSIGRSAFSDCSNLTSIHFATANKATIESLSGYSSKFGATDATIYFDLLDMTLFPEDASYIVNGMAIENNIAGFNINQANSIVAYKAGYCLAFDSITPTSKNSFEHTVNMQTAGVTYTLNISNVPDPTSVTTIFYYGGVQITSIAGSSPSIIVPPNTEITYKIGAKSYASSKGTLQSSEDIAKEITMELVQFTTYDMAYPFSDYSDILSNLVDGTNFEISESPSTVSGTVSPSIVSGSKTYTVSSSYAYGYIKFHTPNTTDTDLLTVSVTCNAYAESNYDVGFVYIDTALHKITSVVKPTTSAGSTNSTYGYFLYNSYGKSTSSYSTYSKVLEADTDYYLQFAYTKDSSNNMYWDRLSITGIKFTDYGTY